MYVEKRNSFSIFTIIALSVLLEVEGHGKQRLKVWRKGLAKGIREQTFDSRREFTMALGAFVVTCRNITLHSIL